MRSRVGPGRASDQKVRGPRESGSEKKLRKSAVCGRGVVRTMRIGVRGLGRESENYTGAGGRGL